LTLYYIYLAIVEFATVYITTVGFIYTGEHITQKIREHYLAAIMRQNIAYFDKIGAGEITTRITADTNLIQDGISEKVGLTLTAFSTFLIAFIIAFVKYWSKHASENCAWSLLKKAALELSLILTSAIFGLAFAMGGGSTLIVKYNKKSLTAYALGGTIAEEVISSIRNVTAFNTQRKLSRQYDLRLTEAEKSGFRMRAALAIMFAAMMVIIYLTYVSIFRLTIQSFSTDHHTGSYILARFTISCRRRDNPLEHYYNSPCRDARCIFTGNRCT
jgi:ATP-binding cassette subfamily B (MDR/TAP) protein 1